MASIKKGSKSAPDARRAPKKPAAKQLEPSKGKKPSSKQAQSSRGTRLQAPSTTAHPARKLTPAELALKESMARFEHGLDLFNRNQFSKAKAIFERLTQDPARELAERARVYLNICDQRLARAEPPLKTAEDLYNYAVSLANQGNPDQAEEHLRRALKLSPESDHIYYALATTYAQRENVEGALENLLRAIELDERNRYQAQNDADFASLLEDPRFTELLYPEKPSA